MRKTFLLSIVLMCTTVTIDGKPAQKGMYINNGSKVIIP